MAGRGSGDLACGAAWFQVTLFFGEDILIGERKAEALRGDSTGWTGFDGATDVANGDWIWLNLNGGRSPAFQGD